MATSTLSLAELNGYSLKITPGLVAGGFSVLLGLLVIIGWHAELITLVQVLPSFPPMPYNSAISFILCGVSLIALEIGHRQFLRGFGTATIVLGGLTLSQYITNIDLHIDFLVIRPDGFPETPYSGRMPLTSAVCFTIGGAALIFTGRAGITRRLLALVGIAGALLAAHGTLAVAAYVLRLERLSELANFSVVALHSGIGFVILGAGITTLAWQRVMRVERDIPHWAFICGGIAVATATVYLWEALRTRTDNIAVLAKMPLDHLADNVVLVFGLALSVALSLVLMYSQQARSRARLAEQEVVERKRAEQLAVRHLTELERINAELEQFAYVASHDLKAPLRGIDSLACWIQEDLGDALQGEPRDHLALLRKRVSRMETLLNDLLAYSRAGHGEIKLERVDSKALVAGIADLSNPPNGFTVTPAEDLPVFETAKAPLEQVLRNLIGNAVKHRDRDTGCVTVSAREDGNFYEFVVSDDGPGIEPEFQERIFKMFQTLKPRDEVEGSGMGLAIVRKLIDRQGGRIWVESREGTRGTRFHFTWPKVIIKSEIAGV